MKSVTINLYEFRELSEEAKEKAINEHFEFMMQVQPEEEEGYQYTRNDVIESIEINAYFFYEDGDMAHCTTYTDKHPKPGAITQTISH